MRRVLLHALLAAKAGVVSSHPQSSCLRALSQQHLNVTQELAYGVHCKSRRDWLASLPSFVPKPPAFRSVLAQRNYRFAFPRTGWFGLARTHRSVDRLIRQPCADMAKESTNALFSSFKIPKFCKILQHIESLNAYINY